MTSELVFDVITSMLRHGQYVTSWATCDVITGMLRHGQYVRY